MPNKQEDGSNPSSSTSSSLTTKMTQQDFCIRNVRRRMWKAFQQDDAIMAMKCYQATKDDLKQWILKEEEQEQQQEEEKRRKYHKEKLGKPKTRRSSSYSYSNNTTTTTNDTLSDITLMMKQMTEDIHLRKTGGISILQYSSSFHPSEPFIPDDFVSPQASYDEPAKTTVRINQENNNDDDDEKKKKKKKNKKAKSAFNPFALLRKSKQNHDTYPSLDHQDIMMEEEDNNNNNIMDVHMTTPLHEAARLGAHEFVKILLKHGGGDANIKNGNARTALHMCAGGLTKEEEVYYMNAAAIHDNKNDYEDLDDEDVPGIRPPKIPKHIRSFINEMNANTEDDKKRRAKKGISKFKAVGKLIMRSNAAAAKLHNKDNAAGAATSSSLSKQQQQPQLDLDRLERLIAERTETALTLLTWSQSTSGNGVSLNAVDDVGRTALHYAAEMGRTEICTAIMSSFGTMLTIVDELGARTPCECASRQGHKDLAAMLEARTLLYIDPYGLDDELLASVKSPNMGCEESLENPELVPPFNWFETLMPRDVEEDRRERLNAGIVKIKDALAIYEKRSSTTHDDGKNMNAMEFAKLHNMYHEEERVDDKEKKEGVIDIIDFSNMQDAHIERFLAFHGWNTQVAVKTFKKNPTDAFRKAAIHLPSTSREKVESDDRLCPICYETVEEEKWLALDGCGHGFCHDCLKGYLKDCSKSLTPVALISCPQHQCNASFPQKDIDSLLQRLPKTAARLKEATIRHYVTSSRNLKFCTHPECPGIVKRLGKNYFVKYNLDPYNLDPNLHDYFGAVCTGVKPKRPPTQSLITFTYEGVDDAEYNNCQSHSQPKRAHRFCFSCGESMHWPVSCARLKDWKQKMRDEIDFVEEDNTRVDANELAQKMWIKANTRTCPQCNVLIEKNDGCNHMTCVNPNCRYEFCWICRRDWKLHSTSTGGYFRCNIWKEEGSPDGNASSNSGLQGRNSDEDNQGYGTAIYSAREQYRQRQEMNRFLHHYTRFEAHGESATLERRMADSASSRLAPVVYAAIDFAGSRTFNFGGKGLSFIHKAFTELLECRSTLKYSYAFSYFRYPTFFQFRRIDELNNIRKEKALFEALQSELEIITEQMSDVVARSHMRASQNQITYLCAGAAEKRVEFANLMFYILNKDLKKSKKDKSHRRKRNLKLDQQSGDYYSSSDDEEEKRKQRSSNMDGVRSFLQSVSGFTQDQPETWACHLCTFLNTGGRMCSMCGTIRAS